MVSGLKRKKYWWKGNYRWLYQSKGLRHMILSGDCEWLRGKEKNWIALSTKGESFWCWIFYFIYRFVFTIFCAYIFFLFWHFVIFILWISFLRYEFLVCLNFCSLSKWMFFFLYFPLRFIVKISLAFYYHLSFVDFFFYPVSFFLSFFLLEKCLWSVIVFPKNFYLFFLLSFSFLSFSLFLVILSFFLSFWKMFVISHCVL